MSNNYYYTNPNDANKTQYSVNDVVSSNNVINNTSTVVNANISTYYNDFPLRSNISIDNNNFDVAVGGIGYKIGGVDLGNSFPAAVDYYTTTYTRNTFTLNWKGVNPKTPQSDCVFNNTSNQTVTIENCFNHVSVIVCGGGGGGGHSSRSGGGGTAGQGGGGGGWGSLHRLELVNVGRSFTVQCGGEGAPGIPFNYRNGNGDGTENVNATSGAFSSFKSNQNGLEIKANGGTYGASPGGNTGVGGNSECNFSITTKYLAVRDTNNAGTNAIGSDDSPGTYGGMCVFDSKTGPNSAVSTLFNHSKNLNVLANNNPGTPAGGNAVNVICNSLDQPVTYNLPSTLTKGGGGGGGSSNNVANSLYDRPGHPGAPGSPGYVIIYKYTS